MRPAIIASLALAGCDSTGTASETGAAIRYDGIETRLLDGDLVNFQVSVANANGPQDVTDYAACAAAQYALIRGYGFARKVRTNC